MQKSQKARYRMSAAHHLIRAKDMVDRVAEGKHSETDLRILAAINEAIKLLEFDP